MSAFYKKLLALPFRVRFAAVIGFIVLEYIVLGKYSLFIVGDNISVLPYYLAFVTRDIPFAHWTPFATAGTDMMATGYATLVYQWVFALLPPWMAFQVLVIAPILAAVLATYGLCRRIFRLDPGPSAFAGCAYGILFFRELFFISSVQGYLPMTLLALHYLLDNKKSTLAWSGIIISGFLIAHSGFITRFFPWPVVTFVIWFFVIERRRKFLDWGIIAIFSIAILASRWQDIIALLAYAPLSGMPETRSGGTFEVEMRSAIMAVKSTLIGQWGVLGFLLASFAVSFYDRNLRAMGGRLLMALGVLVGLVFAGGLVKIMTVAVFPFLNGFSTTYVLQGSGLMTAIASGFGMQFFIGQKNSAASKDGLRAKVLHGIPVLMIVYVLAVNLNTKAQYAKAWVSWGNFYQNTRNPDLLNLAETIGKQGTPGRAMSFQMHGGLLNSYGIETIEGYHPMTSKRYLAFWHKMVEPWRQTNGWKETFGQIESGSLTSILPATRAGRGWERTDVRSQWRLADFVNFDLLSMMNGQYVVSRDRLIDERLTLLSGPQQSWGALSRRDKILTNLKANSPPTWKSPPTKPTMTLKLLKMKRKPPHQKAIWILVEKKS